MIAKLVQHLGSFATHLQASTTGRRRAAHELMWLALLLVCLAACSAPQIASRKYDMAWLHQDTLAWSAVGPWLAVTTSSEVYVYEAQKPYYPQVKKVGGIQAIFASGPENEGVTWSANDWTTAPRGILVYENQFAPARRVRDFENPHSPVRLAQNPQGTRLAGAAYGQPPDSVYVWDTHTRRIVDQLEPRLGNASHLAFSWDGRFLAVGRWNVPEVLVWDVTTGQLACTLAGHREAAHTLAFRPGAALLATGSDDHTVRIWDVAHCRLLHTLASHRAWISDVAFSPDGAVLASSSADGSVVLWDPDQGKQLYRLETHTAWVYDVEFRPAGDWIAAGGSNDTIFVWDVSSGELVQQLHSPNFEGVYELAWNSTGQILAAGAMQGAPAGNVLLWDFDENQWVLRLPGFTLARRQKP
jgi:WD40 repeat protein